MRDLRVLGEHTVDVSLLKRGDWVLDAGCRDFTFARACRDLGCMVLAVDADPTVEDPGERNIVYQNVAVAAEPGQKQIVMTHEPQARHLDGLYVHPASGERRAVSALTIEQLIASTVFSGIERRFAAVKLDVEGSEYEILLKWPGPVARQISVEFHEHCAKRPPELYEAIFQHLGQWYEVVQHVKERRHCLPESWYDTLLVLQDKQEGA